LGTVLGGTTVSNKMMEYNTLFNICDLVGRNLTLPAAAWYATLHRSRRASCVALFAAAAAVSCVLTGSTLCHLYEEDALCHAVWDPVGADIRAFVDTGLVLLRSWQVILAFVAAGAVLDVVRLFGTMLTASLQSAVLTLAPLLTLGDAKGSKETPLQVSEQVSAMITTLVTDKVSEKVSEMAISEKLANSMAAPQNLSRMASDTSRIAESVFTGALSMVDGKPVSRTAAVQEMFWPNSDDEKGNKDVFKKDKQLATYLKNLEPYMGLFQTVTVHLNMNNRVNAVTYDRVSIPYGSILYCFCRHADLAGIERLLKDKRVDIDHISVLLEAHASPESCAVALRKLATGDRLWGSLVEQFDQSP
jgi:hypothetical protein